MVTRKKKKKAGTGLVKIEKITHPIKRIGLTLSLLVLANLGTLWLTDRSVIDLPTKLYF